MNFDPHGFPFHPPALKENAPEKLKKGGASLRFRPDPMRLEAEELELASGVTLIAAVRKALRDAGYKRMPRGAQIFVADTAFSAPYEVPRAQWNSFMLRHGMKINVSAPRIRDGGGGGGKNVLNVILTVIVMIVAVVATVLAPYGAPAWWTGALGLSAASFGYVVGTAVMVGGMLLVNAIAPATAPKLSMGGQVGSETAEKIWAIDGIKNKADLYGIVPLPIGKTRFAPRHFAQPYTFLRGQDMYARYLFGVMGHNRVSSPRIGDTSAYQYKGVRLNVYERWEGQPFQFFTSRIYQENLGVTLKGGSGWNYRTTADDTVEIQWEIHCQRGIFQMPMWDNQYQYKLTRTIDFTASLRNLATGATEYWDFSVSGNTISPMRFGFNRGVPKGQYEFGLVRRTEDGQSDSFWTVADETTWPILRSVRTGEVVRYAGVPYTIFELEIMASDQLNGHVDEFNAVFESYCPVPKDDGTWVSEPSNNPASECLMLMTTGVVGEPAEMEDMDLDSWRGLYDWCNEYGWRFNSVQTSRVACGELVHSVLSSARAAFSIRDGLLSAVWDTPGKPVAYPYGPRNSWGFKGRKEFVEERVHGLRYRFLNDRRDYQEDERIVYNDGYDKYNATNIVTAEQDGVTDPDLIWMHGRLRLADSEWRAEIYEIHTDFSYICVAKGDHIAVTHDVPMWGLRQARVMDVVYAPYDLEGMNMSALMALAIRKQGAIRPDINLAEFTTLISGMSEDALRDLIESNGILDTDYVTHVVIDDHVTMASDKAYAFKYFPNAGPATAFSVETEEGTTNVLKLAIPIPSIDAPLHDGLIHFGVAGQETHSGIVVAIETQDNLCAKIIFQDYSAEQIQAALTGPIPPWDSDITTPTRWQLGKPVAPIINAIRTDELVLLRLASGALIPRIQVAFTIRERMNVTVDEVRIEFRKKGSGAMWEEGGYSPAASGFVYAQGVEELEEYEVRIMALSTLGVGSDYSPVYTVTVIGRTTPPPPPVAVHLDGKRVWWEMGENMPIDVRGWEVWMGFDAEDSFSWARRISNAATLATMGVPGVPQSVTWNGWKIERDADGNIISRALERLDLTPEGFLGLYMAGALAHKARCMEAGGLRKEAAEAAQTLEELEAV